MANAILLRDMLHDDLGIFFIQQLDREANWMAAFTKENPADRAAFNEHWRRIIADPSILMKTIVFNSQVAGYVSKYMDEGKPEITYWIGRGNSGAGESPPPTFHSFYQSWWSDRYLINVLREYC